MINVWACAVELFGEHEHEEVHQGTLGTSRYISRYFLIGGRQKSNDSGQLQQTMGCRWLYDDAVLMLR